MSLSFALLFVLASGQQNFPHSPLLARHSTIGDHLSYHMTCVNQDRARTVRYSATANGIVGCDPTGRHYEEFGWSDMIVDNKPFELPASSLAFHQTHSLEPGFYPPFPNLSQVSPMLIGPITDLMTFYVDLQMAMTRPDIAKAGDHAFVPLGRPASWADGSNVLIGEDAIDFDIKLKSVDRKRDVATVVVDHVPSAKPNIKLLADWMRQRVADTPNNWVQVTKNPEGEFVVGVGKETFHVEIKVRISDGKLLSATQDNVVEVMERTCSNPYLNDPGKPIRYRIHRYITIR
ncbi:MAG TPA: hypothetical protein VG944_05785 [Fimbriimonas sp.]|nr:hypothetical protein [Fimbriimonas sp.]